MMLKGLKKLATEDNFLSFSGNMVTAILGFAGFALLTRSFSLVVFGEWIIFISAGTFIEMFRFGVTNTAIIRYLSGATTEERDTLIGTNGVIGLTITVFIAVLLMTCNILFGNAIGHSGYAIFFTWYPLLALINLPYNTALVILQADQKFGKILFIKLVNSGGFFLVLLANFLYFRMNVTQLVWALLTVNFISSAICTVKGWDGFGHLRKASRQTSRTLLDFGKYTTFTLIGSNLLRSADTFIISLSPLGTAAVALYSIPLKLTEIQQIPLRSFTATAFPKMSKACIQGRLKEVRDLFYTYSGAMTFLFIGISLVTFFFAGLFVLVLGGRHYLGVDPVTGFSTVPLVRIFAVYGLLLPIDRMTGITLDSLNLPAKNAIKVFVMVALNIAGDLLAVFWFRSLMMAAVASILFTVAGIAIGFHFLRQAIPLNPFLIFTRGIEFYRFLWEKFRLHFIRPT